MCNIKWKCEDCCYFHSFQMGGNKKPMPASPTALYFHLYEKKKKHWIFLYSEHKPSQYIYVSTYTVLIFYMHFTQWNRYKHQHHVTVKMYMRLFISKTKMCLEKAAHTHSHTTTVLSFYINVVKWMDLFLFFFLLHLIDDV